MDQATTWMHPLTTRRKMSCFNLVVLLTLSSALVPAQEIAPLTDAANAADQDQEVIEIVGSVADKQGSPIVNADIIYPYAFDRYSTRTISATAVSNETGEFVLHVPNSPLVDGKMAYAESLVWAYSKGYCLEAARVVTDCGAVKLAPIHIELVPETDTTLVIVNPDGQPIQDVLVEPMNYKTPSAFSLIPSDTKDQLAQRTDAQGRVNLPALSRDRLFSVWVTSEDYGIQSQQFTVSKDEPAERNIQLRPVGRIQGTIPKHDLQWTLKVKLWFTSNELMKVGQARPPWPTEGIAKASVDAFGRIRVPRIAEGHVQIDALVDDSLSVRPTLPDRIEVKAGELTEFKMPMQELIKIHGSLIAEDNQSPLSGIKIHVYYGEFRQGTNVTTDENGQFTALVLPGAVRFQPMNLHSTKYLQLGQPKPVVVSATDNKVPPIEVVLAEPRDGKVINRLGVPVANANVSAYYGNWLCSTATTNGDGQFNLPKMPATIASDQATYRVHLENGVTFNSANVVIKSASPLVLKIGL